MKDADPHSPVCTTQDERLKIGGFVGSVSLEGNIGPFMPLIKAGEVFHVGKGTSFGLGKYEVINQ